MRLGSFWEDFGVHLGSGTPLQAPLGPEVGARRLRTGKKLIFMDFGSILGSVQGPSEALFRIVLVKKWIYGVIFSVFFARPVFGRLRTRFWKHF